MSVLRCKKKHRHKYTKFGVLAYVKLAFRLIDDHMGKKVENLALSSSFGRTKNMSKWGEAGEKSPQNIENLSVFTPSPNSPHFFWKSGVISPSPHFKKSHAEH